MHTIYSPASVILSLLYVRTTEFAFVLRITNIINLVLTGIPSGLRFGCVSTDPINFIGPSGTWGVGDNTIMSMYALFDSSMREDDETTPSELEQAVARWIRTEYIFRRSKRAYSADASMALVRAESKLRKALTGKQMLGEAYRALQERK